MQASQSHTSGERVEGGEKNGVRTSESGQVGVFTLHLLFTLSSSPLPTGESGTDLVGYVEFQKNQKLMIKGERTLMRPAYPCLTISYRRSPLRPPKRVDFRPRFLAASGQEGDFLL